MSPLIATQFSQLPRWSFHWLVALGLAALDVILLAIIFRLRDRNGRGSQTKAQSYSFC